MPPRWRRASRCAPDGEKSHWRADLASGRFGRRAPLTLFVGVGRGLRPAAADPRSAASPRLSVASRATIARRHACISARSPTAAARAGRKAGSSPSRWGRARRVCGPGKCARPALGRPQHRKPAARPGFFMAVRLRQKTLDKSLVPQKSAMLEPLRLPGNTRVRYGFLSIRIVAPGPGKLSKPSARGGRFVQASGNGSE